MLRGRGGGAGDAFGALTRAGMSSSSSSGGVTDLAAVAARSTPAEQKHLGALQGAMMSARAELEKRAAQNVSLDWSKFDQKSESIKALKTYYESFKPPPVDASIVADLKKKFDAVEKALEADAKAAKLEIATIEKELEKLNFELVRLVTSDHIRSHEVEESIHALAGRATCLRDTHTQRERERVRQKWMENVRAPSVCFRGRTHCVHLERT